MALIKLKTHFARHAFRGDELRSFAPAQGRAARMRLVTRKNRDRRAQHHFGRITTRHIGGGSRQKYRIIDFKRDKDGIAGNGRAARDTIQTAPRTWRWCSTTTASVATSWRPRACSAGDEIRVGRGCRRSKPGNARCALRHIPVGSTIHNIELKPGKGGQLVRSARRLRAVRGA